MSDVNILNKNLKKKYAVLLAKKPGVRAYKFILMITNNITM